jgi:hypothetical protein
MGYHQVPVAAPGLPKIIIITPFNLSEYFFTAFGFSNLVGDVSTGVFRPIVPAKFRKIFLHLHNPVSCFF